MFSPTITIATFFAGLATLPRAILYVVAQSIGAIVGGYWLRLGLGDAYFPEVRSLNALRKSVLLMLLEGRDPGMYHCASMFGGTTLRPRVHVCERVDLHCLWSRLGSPVSH